MKKTSKLLLILLVGSLTVMGQYANQQTLYKNLPQARYLNPGTTGDYAGYFSLPMLSGYGITASNSGFAFKDAFVDGNLSFDNLLSTMNEKNYLNVGFATDIIGFGFKAGKNNFAINITPKSDVNLGYNKALFDFIVNGNGAYVGQDISLDGFAFDVTSYLETGIGYNREVTDQLSVGGRVKVLFGIGNMSGDFDGISLHTDEDDYSLSATSDFAINTYGAFLVNDSIADVLGNPSTFNPKNLGLGLDVGANYKLTEKINIFASIIDLGYIKWADYGESLANNGATFTYDGLPYDELIGSNDDTGNEESNFFEGLTDSITNTFGLERSQISYRTQLKTKLFAGADYKVNEFVEANGLVYGRVFNNKFYPALMLGGGVQLKRWLTAKLTYSAINGSYDNIGGGVVLNLGAFQVYAMADNLTGLAKVDYARSFNGSFGMNITFKAEDGKVEKAKKKKEKAKKDLDKAKKNKKLSEEEKDKAVKEQEKIIEEQEKTIEKEEKKAKKEEKKAEEKKEKAEEKKSEKSEEKKDKAEEKKAEKVEEKKEKAEEKKEEKKEKAEEKKAEKKEEKAEAKEVKEEKKALKEEAKEIKEEAKEVKAEAKAVEEEAKAIKESTSTLKDSVVTPKVEALKAPVSEEPTSISDSTKAIVEPLNPAGAQNDSTKAIVEPLSPASAQNDSTKAIVTPLSNEPVSVQNDSTKAVVTPLPKPEAVQNDSTKAIVAPLSTGGNE